MSEPAPYPTGTAFDRRFNTWIPELLTYYTSPRAIALLREYLRPHDVQSRAYAEHVLRRWRRFGCPVNPYTGRPK